MAETNGQQTVTISVMMGPQGLQVQGPLKNKVLCYGLLVAAVLEVFAWKEPLVQVPQIIPPTDPHALPGRG